MSDRTRFYWSSNPNRPDLIEDQTQAIAVADTLGLPHLITNSDDDTTDLVVSVPDCRLVEFVSALDDLHYNIEPEQTIFCGNTLAQAYLKLMLRHANVDVDESLPEPWETSATDPDLPCP